MVTPVVAVVEARMASTRLPGKVLALIDGLPAIQHLVNRLERLSAVTEVIIATTDDASDDVLASYMSSVGVRAFRGSNDDVLGRIAGAVVHSDCEIVLSITADCPGLDPAVVSDVLSRFHEGSFDYVSNSIVRTYPDGMDCGVYRHEALNRASRNATDPLEREHTSLHVRRRPDQFAISNVRAPAELVWPELGLTLDTDEDLRFLNSVVTSLADSPFPSCLEMIALLRAHPELLEINSHVHRRGDA